MGAARRSQALLIAAAVIILTISAKVQIPLWPVPMTMQTYAVLVIGMAFGFRLGLSAVGTYVALGALGLPVFAGSPAQGAGLPYMLGPTGGYLLGFLVAAAACGALAERGWDRRLATSLVAMIAGHALIFACGIAWLATLVGLERAVEAGLLPFLFATLVKTLLAAISLPMAWKFVGRSSQR
jgi:biotin transport system substrate-specific component